MNIRKSLQDKKGNENRNVSTFDNEKKRWKRKEMKKTFQIYLQHISVYDDVAVWREANSSPVIFLSTSLPLEMDEAKVI